MGLLDPNLFSNPVLLNQLKGLLGNMPISKLIKGEESVTQEGLLGAMRAMPVFSPDAGQSAYDAAMNIGPMGIGKIVYHGSPHKFDKFDASKIGTGEGAQAYGHGIYTADSPEVAAGYARTLGGREFDIGGRKIYATSGGSTRALDQQAMHEKIAADALDDAFNAQSSSPAQFAANRLRQQRKLYPDQAGDIDRAMNVIADWQEKGSTQQITGQVYKADLPDEWIPKMLDWDKPLSEQPKSVRDALEPFVAPIRKEMAMPAGKEWGDLASPQKYDPTGAELLGIFKSREASAQSILSNGLGPDVSARLREAGIPGIRYLDGGSRGKGQGSYNYVVFPGLEDKVKILERNGVPLQGLLGGN